MRDAPLYRSSHSALSARWRWQNSVCFSYTPDAKKSVNMETALRVHVVMGVSLVWYEDAKGNPS